MRSKSDILEDSSIYSLPTEGIGSWLTERTHDDVFARLGNVDDEPLSAVQLNQLLVLGHEAPVGDGFFQYYWLQAPEQHPFSTRDIPGFSEKWLESQEMIVSLAHLKWGLHRLYTDGLLYFGNVRTAFRSLRDLTFPEIEAFFDSERFDTEAIKRRGPSLPLKPIAKDSRYLISEMACKSYGDSAVSGSDLQTSFWRPIKRTLPRETPRLRFGSCLRIEFLQCSRCVSRSLSFPRTKCLTKTSHRKPTSRRNTSG